MSVLADGCSHTQSTATCRRPLCISCSVSTSLLVLYCIAHSSSACLQTAAKGCLELLLPYTEHRNPKVRGLSGACCAAAAPRLTEEDWTSLGFARMLKAAGKL